MRSVKLLKKMKKLHCLVADEVGLISASVPDSLLDVGGSTFAKAIDHLRYHEMTSVCIGLEKHGQQISDMMMSGSTANAAIRREGSSGIP